jgi:hypothetical protein
MVFDEAILDEVIITQKYYGLVSFFRELLAPILTVNSIIWKPKNIYKQVLCISISVMVKEIIALEVYNDECSKIDKLCH